jgi:hypothetical protein
MTDKTKRVQLSRQKGWRMPPNTVKVDRSRPNLFGNPWKIVRRSGQYVVTRDGYADQVFDTKRGAAAYAVECFAVYAPSDEPGAMRMRAGYGRVRGKSVGCWCALDMPCHGDVLLRLANAPA